MNKQLFCWLLLRYTSCTNYYFLEEKKASWLIFTILIEDFGELTQLADCAQRYRILWTKFCHINLDITIIVNIIAMVVSPIRSESSIITRCDITNLHHGKKEKKTIRPAKVIMFQFDVQKKRICKRKRKKLVWFEGRLGRLLVG